jgi:hypothetical protein
MGKQNILNIEIDVVSASRARLICNSGLSKSS